MKLTWLHNMASEFFTVAFFKFLVVGVINTFDCSLFAMLLMMLSIDGNLAFNLGYLLSNMLAYALNSWWIFPEPLSWRRYVKFMISYIPNAVIENVIVVVFYNWLGAPPLVSFLLAAVLGMPVTYILVKWFAFDRRFRD
ncbi:MULTISPECIES: GtrA family protein [Selenomonas]|uniref:GtrA-like protein n=2 Tax=Selenomonas ruminantium TaxID=971 RepID=A0A1K1QQ28_SELRU|nr:MULTISPECIES: GtrA family protein [Selenomonas]SDZ83637.1 GtrA-like protein [Selenomonas ruminantium]SFA85691.1 GtrA-like protein [Selenomonas ruminantium]SFW62000.1 GtrA-like protein [Selenomonas ruminantium]